MSLSKAPRLLCQKQSGYFAEHVNCWSTTASADWFVCVVVQLLVNLNQPLKNRAELAQLFKAAAHQQLTSSVE